MPGHAVSPRRDYTEHVITVYGAPTAFKSVARAGGGMELTVLVDDESKKGIMDLVDHRDFIFEFRVYTIPLYNEDEFGEAGQDASADDFADTPY